MAGRSDVLDVWNAALSAVTGRAAVSNREERSREAEVCRRWYPIVRDAIQEAAWWPGSRRTASLALLAQRGENDYWKEGDPAPEYTHAYALPNDYLRAWYLSPGVSGYRSVVGFRKENLIPFSIELYKALGEDTHERLALHTSYPGHRNDSPPPVILTYAKTQDLPSLWIASQFDATTFALAARIALPLTGREALAAGYYQKANELLIAAQAAALNSSDEINDPLPDWLEARHSGIQRPRDLSGFRFPFGPLFGSNTPYPDARN